MIGFPIRFCSRAKRDAEDQTETINLDKVEFQQLIDKGDIGIWWERDLTVAWSTNHLYGFENNERPIQVLSANNAFFSMPKIRLAKILHTAKVVYLRSSTEVKKQRLITRSPEIGELETHARLVENNSYAIAHADIIIDNEQNRIDQLLQSAFTVLNNFALINELQIKL